MYKQMMLLKRLLTATLHMTLAVNGTLNPNLASYNQPSMHWSERT